MTVYEWLVNRIDSSTEVSADVIPDYVNSTLSPPLITYYDTGFNRNKLEKNSILAIHQIHNSKSELESLNTNLYSLFDSSTAYIRESSSNLYIDSVTIINNSNSGYDETNKTYWKELEISVWYH